MMMLATKLNPTLKLHHHYRHYGHYGHHQRWQRFMGLRQTNFASTPSHMVNCCTHGGPDAILHPEGHQNDYGLVMRGELTMCI